jgi:hypothetical protein
VPSRSGATQNSRTPREASGLAAVAPIEKPIDIDPAPAARGGECIAHLGAVDDDHRCVHLHRVAQLVAHSREGRLERLGKTELDGDRCARGGGAHGRAHLQSHRLEARAQPPHLVDRAGVHRPVEIADAERGDGAVERAQRSPEIDLDDHNDEQHCDQDHSEQHEH